MSATLLSLEEALARIDALRQNLDSVIRGKRECVDVLVLAILSGGSVLMEDVPGVGKTTLAKAVARSLSGEFRRVQFTPDLLPSDILGASIYSPVTGTFTFRQGPIFCNVLLADEINRASPRTQSALLEAMSEAQATIEGTRYVLPAPFLVLATQNPVEYHGTYPLPEAQLDRFQMQVSLGYPERETEIDILFDQAETHPLDRLEPAVSSEDVLSLQSMVRQVRFERSIAKYLIDIVAATRQDQRLKLGVSPRGSLMLFRAAQAGAFADGRDYVLPDDVQRLAPHVLSHRIAFTSKARYGSTSRQEIVHELLDQIRVPT